MFLDRFVVVAATLILLTLPLLVLARRKRTDHTARNFVIGALTVAAACGILADSSARLVRQCLEAGYPGCIDIGAAGFQALLIGGYLAALLASTYVIWRE